MIELSVSIPDDLMRWVNQRIAEGPFSNPEEYMHHLIKGALDLPTGYIAALSKAEGGI